MSTVGNTNRRSKKKEKEEAVIVALANDVGDSSTTITCTLGDKSPFQSPECLSVVTSSPSVGSSTHKTRKKVQAAAAAASTYASTSPAASSSANTASSTSVHAFKSPANATAMLQYALDQDIMINHSSATTSTHHSSQASTNESKILKENKKLKQQGTARVAANKRGADAAKLQDSDKNNNNEPKRRKRMSFTESESKRLLLLGCKQLIKAQKRLPWRSSEKCPEWISIYNDMIEGETNAKRIDELKQHYTTEEVCQSLSLRFHNLFGKIFKDTLEAAQQNLFNQHSLEKLVQFDLQSQYGKQDIASILNYTELAEQRNSQIKSMLSLNSNTYLSWFAGVDKSPMNVVPLSDKSKEFIYTT